MAELAMAANISEKLYIPKKVLVGFQSREGTYTGKLAYVIYWDDKGVLRKEKSWESWRDKNIKVLEFDNTPQSNFVLNKDIRREGYYWASGRNMIRIYDPRGVEFEITPANLIGILTYVDCNKRDLQGEFVYAWSGTELVVLPVASEEYQESLKFTALQSQKFSAKKLVPGRSYTTKKQEEFIYLGRLDCYNEKTSYVNDGRITSWAKDRKHIFVNRNEEHRYEYGISLDNVRHEFGLIEMRDSVNFIAQENSTDVVPDFAQLIDNYKQLCRSDNISAKELLFSDFTLKKPNRGGYSWQQDDFHPQYFTIGNPKTHMYDDKCFIKTGEDTYDICIIQIVNKNNSMWSSGKEGLIKVSKLGTANIKTNEYYTIDNRNGLDVLFSCQLTNASIAESIAQVNQFLREKNACLMTFHRASTGKQVKSLIR
jgi:hypothetical protein